jgi:ankyrin repeat protein
MTNPLSSVLLSVMIVAVPNSTMAGDDDAATFHLAASEGDLSVVRELLDKGIRIESTTDYGRTALHLASMGGHSDVVFTLLEHGARIDPLDAEGVTPLGLTIPFCRLEAAELLIFKGADVNRRFDRGATMLHALPYSKGRDRHASMAELLIAAGADIEARTVTERNTPLHVAALFGDVALTEVLLAAGADVASGDASGHQPLHNAAAMGQPEMIVLLLEHGAEVDVTDDRGMTPLHWAAARGRLGRVDLQRFGTWRRDGVPLRNDYLTAAQELIDRGASLTALDRKGRSPWKLARKRKEPRMIALLETTTP